MHVLVAAPGEVDEQQPVGPELLAAVGERRGNAETSQDVHDPYGRGPEAAETCATQIDELLRVVVPALTGSTRIGA